MRKVEEGWKGKKKRITWGGNRRKVKGRAAISRHELLQQPGLHGLHLVQEHIRAVLCHVQTEEDDQASQELPVARWGKLLEPAPDTTDVNIPQYDSRIPEKQPPVPMAVSPLKSSARQHREELGELGWGDVAKDCVQDGKGMMVRHLLSIQSESRHRPFQSRLILIPWSS